MSPIKITEGDLLDALRDALAAPANGDGLTGPELARALGWSIGGTRDALRAIAAQGRLEVVNMPRAGIDGRVRMVPGYRIKAPKKKVGTR